MNLIQMALAADRYFQHQDSIQYTGSQCVRSKYVYATCDRCVECCPTQAIRLDDNHLPALDSERCVRCGACLHVCPVGAFEHRDGLYHVLNCAEQVVDREILDIACAYHPSAATTDRAVDGVIQTGHCLSELGPSAYIGLKAVGVKHIRARQDACSTCPLRVLQPAIDQSVNRAQRLLAAFGMQDEVTIEVQPGAAWRKRPLYQSKNPPISRRGFLTLLSGGSPSRAREIAAALDDQETTGKGTPRERQRLLAALRLLIAPGFDLEASVTLDAGDFAQFVVDDSCTACGLCERVCPTGALQVEKTGAVFSVNFAPGRCTNCGLCATYCEPEALRLAGQPSLWDVQEGTVMPLYSGPLRQCQRCQTLFASQSDEDLCEVCRQRPTPFSGSLPDAILAKLPPAARKRLTPSTPSDPIQNTE